MSRLITLILVVALALMALFSLQGLVRTNAVLLRIVSTPAEGPGPSAVEPEDFTPMIIPTRRSI